MLFAWVKLNKIHSIDLNRYCRMVLLWLFAQYQGKIWNCLFFKCNYIKCFLLPTDTPWRVAAYFIVIFASTGGFAYNCIWTFLTAVSMSRSILSKSTHFYNKKNHCNWYLPTLKVNLAFLLCLYSFTCQHQMSQTLLTPNSKSLSIRVSSFRQLVDICSFVTFRNQISKGTPLTAISPSAARTKRTVRTCSRELSVLSWSLFGLVTVVIFMLTWFFDFYRSNVKNIYIICRQHNHHVHNIGDHGW